MKIITKLILTTRFFTILACLIFICSSHSASLAQSTIITPLTDVEKKEAEKLASQFAVRFSQTKDLRPLLKEFFSDDFIERYKKKSLGDIDGNDRNIFIIPGLYVRKQILKDVSSKEWENIYIASNNFLLSGMTFLAKIILQNKDKDNEGDADESIDKMFSPKLRTLFDKNQNLADVIERKGKSRPISSVDELKTAIEVLDQGTKISNEEQPEALTEKEIRNMFELIDGRLPNNTKADITDEGEYGLPKGTRVIHTLSPLMYYLTLVKKDNKLVIVDAVLYAD